MSRLLVLTICMLIGLWACQEQEKEEKAQAINVQTGDPAIDAVSAKIARDSTNAALYAKRGSIYYARQVFRESIRDYNKALLLDSTKINYYHKLADAYLESNDSYTALEVLRDAKRRFPAHIPTLLKLADFQLITKQYLDGLKNVNAAIQKSPQNADAYYLKGLFYRDMNAPLKAMEAFQKAVELNPDLSDAYLIMGNMMSQENPELALRFYNNALLSNPKDAIALHSKALHLHQMGRLDEAIVTYKKVHRLDPRYAEAFYNGGLLYLELDSVQKAQNLFNIAIANDPFFAKSFYYRGETHRMQENWADAMDDYKKALEINPNMKDAQRRLEELKEKESIQ